MQRSVTCVCSTQIVSVEFLEGERSEEKRVKEREREFENFILIDCSSGSVKNLRQRERQTDRDRERERDREEDIIAALRDTERERDRDREEDIITDALSLLAIQSTVCWTEPGERFMNTETG